MKVPRERSEHCDYSMFVQFSKTYFRSQFQLRNKLLKINLPEQIVIDEI